MSAAIAFERVSKHYRAAAPYRSLREDMGAAARRAVGRTTDAHVVKALDDVTLEIPEGESTGLIGVNGAGKTTALKLASRITYPTSGKLRIRGRVGALIEVSTGLHPELSGRENVSLYGRILGLSRRDVRRRFDEIVTFADIGPALEQPVKQFSSGMQLRLGFALAAFLEPDVLLVDEAIAVGDAGFQYRCVERMRELVAEGRTLVLVTHNLGAIETLCRRAVLLHDGALVADGAADEVIREYLHRVDAQLVESQLVAPTTGAGGLTILSSALLDESGQVVEAAEAGRPITVRLEYEANEPIARPIFEIGIAEGRFGPLVLASMLIDGEVPDRIEGRGSIDCTFLDLPLRPRMYELWGGVRGEAGFGEIVDWHRLRLFRVMGETGAGIGAVSHSMTNAPVALPYRWAISDGGEPGK